MSTRSTAVEQRAPGVPALANTPALEIDSSDVVLPRIRIGQQLSDAVGEGLAKLGNIYATSGKDDPSPDVLYDGTGEGVLFHVIGIKKGLSWKDGNDELQSTYFGDPDAPEDARTTYDYTLVLPEATDGEDVPFKFLLSGASTNAAKLINTIIKKNQARGPAWNLAFRVTTAEKSTTKGSKTFKYHVAQVRQVEAQQPHVDIAESLAALVAGSNVEAAPPAAKPAI